MTEYIENTMGTEEFVSIAKLSKVIGLGARGIRRWIEKKEIGKTLIKKEPYTGRNGYRYLINPRGIPEPYRRQYLYQIAKSQIKEHQDSVRKQLPNWAIEKASARLDLIYFLEQELSRAKKEGRNIKPVYHETAEIYNSGIVFKEAYKILGEISGHTLEQRWWPSYKSAVKKGKDIIIALAPKYNTNKGQRKLPLWYQEMIKKVLLHPSRFTPTRGIKIVNAELRNKNIKIPCSVKTALRWVNEFKNEYHDQWVLMRKGIKALNDEVLPYLKRNWNSLKVGQVLIADGHVLNFDVKHPFTGKAHRPTLICFYDGRSRMPVGLSIMPTESTDNISEALADAVHTLGKFPDAVILDNGRAFKAKHFTKNPEFYDSGLAGIYERYGIMTHFTKAYHAQSKPIEPFFKQLNERFSKMLPTYLGNSISNQVPRLRRNEKLHAKAYRDQVGDWLPTIPEVVNAIKKWSIEAYGREEHGGLRKGETPLQVLKNGQGPGVPYQLMADLLLRSKEMIPHRAEITLEGIVYQNGDVLTGCKKPIIVRYTRRIPEKVWFYFSGEYPIQIYEAYAVETVNPLQKLTNEEGEFDPYVREKLMERERFKKRAMKATEAYRNISDVIAEPIGKYIPNYSKRGDDEIMPHYSETPSPEENEIEPDLLKLPDLEDLRPEEDFFEYAFQRFDHIAEKKKVDITKEDIAFLRAFTKMTSYTELYEKDHSNWVENLLNQEK